MFFPPDTLSLAKQVIEAYGKRKKKIATAESCTGGLISAALTAISGSSDVFERGFTTYSYEAKTEVLGVLPEVLQRHGAVSAEVAAAMAEGALDFSHADIALSVTGIAGPKGGLPNKPVGLIFFGIATRENVKFHLNHVYQGDRSEIRLQCVNEALKLLLSLVTD